MSVYSGTGGWDGLTAATAAPSAISILQATKGCPDGLYWIKNSRVNGGAPLRVYCDMTRYGGGWILLLCNSNINGSTKLQGNNYLSYNTGSPSITQSYSILSYADGFKRIGPGFQYMIEAGAKGQLGGIWTANQPYSFTSNSNGNTDIKMDVMFSSWTYNDNSVEARMPYSTPGTNAGTLTTSTSFDGSWWGSLAEGASSFSPAPWMNSGVAAGTYPGVSDTPGYPGIIWYWMR